MWENGQSFHEALNLVKNAFEKTRNLISHLKEETVNIVGGEMIELSHSQNQTTPDFNNSLYSTTGNPIVGIMASINGSEPETGEGLFGGPCRPETNSSEETDEDFYVGFDRIISIVVPIVFSIIFIIGIAGKSIYTHFVL